MSAVVIAVEDYILECPSGFRVIREMVGVDGYACDSDNADLTVIVSVAREDDGRRWKHVSVSRRDRQLPSWGDMRKVKDAFVGPDAYAYQVFPPEALYVNIHPGVLHLWQCLDGQAIPEFSGFVAGKRSI
jgi:hypothetical protein